jgi:hypothetical protein
MGLCPYCEMLASLAVGPQNEYADGLKMDLHDLRTATSSPLQ